MWCVSSGQFNWQKDLNDIQQKINQSHLQVLQKRQKKPEFGIRGTRTAFLHNPAQFHTTGSLHCVSLLTMTGGFIEHLHLVIFMNSIVANPLKFSWRWTQMCNWSIFYSCYSLISVIAKNIDQKVPNHSEQEELLQCNSLIILVKFLNWVAFLAIRKELQFKHHSIFQRIQCS